MGAVDYCREFLRADRARRPASRRFFSARIIRSAKIYALTPGQFSDDGAAIQFLLHHRVSRGTALSGRNLFGYLTAYVQGAGSLALAALFAGRRGGHARSAPGRLRRPPRATWSSSPTCSPSASRISSAPTPPARGSRSRSSCPGPSPIPSPSSAARIRFASRTRTCPWAKPRDAGHQIMLTIPQIEALRRTNPQLYEALKRLAERVARPESGLEPRRPNHRRHKFRARRQRTRSRQGKLTPQNPAC